MRYSVLSYIALAALTAMIGSNALAADDYTKLRFATFNASLYAAKPGELAERLRNRKDDQLKRVAGIIQAVRPDVLLINEFDYDSTGRSVEDFIFNYLMRGQFGLDGIRYRFSYVGPVNTGIASPYDLNRDGKVEGPGDAWGYGAYPGQYGMLVLSRYPIATRQLRTFRLFKWKDMPNALLPIHGSGQAWYSDTMLRWFPLSSKSMWDVPIWTGSSLVHFIVSHPTPPAFDGDEKRNSRRNHDEIRLVADYVSGDQERSAYIYDDEGHRGGLESDHPFVIAGDLNADPLDGNSHPGAIDQLLKHDRIGSEPIPASEGGPESAHRMGGSNLTHRGDPAHDTAVFGDPPGNLRVDYVLPSNDIRIVDSGVYWPLSTENGAALLDATDHRLVWVDLEIPASKPGIDRRPRVGKNR